MFFIAWFKKGDNCWDWSNSADSPFSGASSKSWQKKSTHQIPGWDLRWVVRGVFWSESLSNQTCFLILATCFLHNIAVFRNCVAISSNMFYLHIFIGFSDASPISCKCDQFFSYNGLTCLMARLLPWNPQTLSWHSTLSFGKNRQAKIEILVGVFSPTHLKSMSQIRSSPHIRGKINTMFQTTKAKILGLE